MADFRVLHIPCGVIGTNTYVVYHEDGGEAVVIDRPKARRCWLLWSTTSSNASVFCSPMAILIT